MLARHLRYLCQFRCRQLSGLCRSSQRFPSKGVITAGPSPCARLSRAPSTMAARTSRAPSRRPRWLGLCRRYCNVLAGRMGSPTFIHQPSRRAMLSDSGDASQVSPFCTCDVLPSTDRKVWAIPTNRISELNHFDLAAYGSSLSLSTLNPFRYLHRPKTRSGMRRAPLSRGDFHPDMVNASWRTRSSYSPFG